MLFLSKQSNFCCFRCVISTLTKMLNFYGSFFTLINIRTEDISRFKEKRLKSVTSGNLCKIRKIYVVTIIIRRFEQLSVTKYNENVVKNRFFLKKSCTPK